MMRLAVDNGPALGSNGRRRTVLAQVHIARKVLDMDEGDYRALVERLTGQSSAKNCSDRELALILAEFQRMGWLPSRGRPKRKAGGSPVLRKARALWISLYQLGAISDPSEAKLEAFGCRQLGVSRLQWSSERDAFRLIEALKAMAERHGWQQSLPAKLPKAQQVRILQGRLIEAQRHKLARSGEAVAGHLAGDWSAWSHNQMERAADELGARIRALPKSAALDAATN